MSLKNKPTLVLDVSPLWETQYTGISNVAYEITKRFLTADNSMFKIVYSVLSYQIEPVLIEKCLKARSGELLQKSFREENHFLKKSEGDNFWLHLHKKQKLNKKPIKEALFFHDFSVFLTPECHESETVRYFSNDCEQDINNADLFFCNSQSTANDLSWIFNVPKENIIVTLLGNNVDINKTKQARRLIEDKLIEPYFLILGTIEPRKNIAIILAWLEKNRNLTKEYRFIFAGRQGWGKEFQEYITEYNLNHEVELGRIIHYGYINESQKSMLLVGAKALLYPSIFEGFGLPILEAMEVGVPVIASCSTSIPEVLGENGYYFDPYSLESFNKAFFSFIKDDLSGDIINIKIKGQKRAKDFSYDQMYLTIYNTLVNRFLQ